MNPLLSAAAEPPIDPAMPALTLPDSSAVETPAAASAPPAEARSLNWMEAGAAAFGTLLTVYLIYFLYRHIGALWRDEANSVAIATLRPFSETWDNLQFDSYPILYLGLLRGWAAIFSPANDAALRVPGFLIGLGIVGALWLNARLLRFRYPLMCMALLGCNPLFIRYAESIRAYGLGVLLMLLTLGTVWRAVEDARPRRVLLAMAVAVVSVQCVYYNSVLLFAMCMAGAIVAASEKHWRKVACVLAIGAPAAVSLLPYLGTIHRLKDWNFMIQFPATFPWILDRLYDVTGSPDPAGIYIWDLLLIGAAALGGYRIFRGRKVSGGGKTDRAVLFTTTALVIGAVCYAVFLKALNYRTQPWYYITFMAFAAICLETIYARTADAARSNYWRYGRVVFLLGFSALTFLQAMPQLTMRQTNLDFAAKQLEQIADKDDLILHVRWECAVTFCRYYHGQTPQVTLPPISDHRFQRYDQVKEQMTLDDPVAPVRQKMAETLQSGHKIWLLGNPRFEHSPWVPLTAPPLRKDARGWVVGGPYYDVWTAQASEYIAQHTTRAAIVGVKVGQAVMPYENLRLSVFQGWKPDAAPAN